jgi:hypothetical protein
MRDKLFKKKNFLTETLRLINGNESALILTKGIDSWPINSKSDTQSGTIDLWWIIQDGGLLLLLVFLLKKHRIWQKCKVRLFTVAQSQENSIQIKNDLAQYMYYLRIDAEVDVVEMNEGEISAYTYEKTLRLHEREKIIKQMKLKESQAENEPQIMIERVRQNSKHAIEMQQINDAKQNEEESEEEFNSKMNQYTFTPASSQLRRPSVFQTETIRKMHSAVELNKKVLEKSKDASLVLMNIPAPPKNMGVADYNCKYRITFNVRYILLEFFPIYLDMAYLNAATEGLNRVLLVRGSGREVITIFS